MSDFDYLLKYIIVGDSGVGKSCILYQFISKIYKKDLEPTIGIEFATKTLKINKKTIRLQIWDSAGQENYRSITRSYYRNTIVAFLVYDITKINSFENIKNWLDEISTFSNKNIYLVLVGNKLDLKEKRVVTKKEAKKFAKEFKMDFFEVSAKSGEFVDDCFEKTTKKILEDCEAGIIDPFDEILGVKVGVRNLEDAFLKKVKKKKKCC